MVAQTPANAPGPTPSWLPAARLAAIVVGVLAFAALMYVYIAGGRSGAFWLMGLALVIYVCYAVHNKVSHQLQGGQGEPAWVPMKLAPVPQGLYLDGKERTTEARFVPEKLWGPQKLSAPAILLLLFGIAFTLVGMVGMKVVVGVLGIVFMIVGFWINPTEERGIWQGSCPHCGEAMSAFKHASVFECPQCEHQVLRREDRFVAVPPQPRAP
jgi:predicted RNA-binding Zn-ribbon protein involved in translation (DUF1610 family)